MKKTFIIFGLCILTLVSCNLNDDNTFTPTLPPVTEIGANTFGCYIDGQLLTPRDGRGSVFGPDSGMSFISGPDSFNYHEISIYDFKSGTGGLLDIHIENLHEIGEGIHTINESNCDDNVDALPTLNIRCRWWDENLQAYKWYCSIENAGTLTISRYDYDNKIVSGTFQCTVRNEINPEERIEITQGRFDINRLTLSETEFP